MADVKVAFDGWNSSSHGWGEGTWGNGSAFPASTASVGSVSVSADANVTATGNSATVSVGSVSVSASASVSVSGNAATASVGSVSVTATPNLSLIHI